MRNHFLSLPAEIIEAARMDGARWWQLLLRVVLPMSRPTMVAVGVITVVNEWNEYLWPFLMSDDESVAPLPIGLTFLQQAEGVTNWGPVMAVTLLAMLPILLVFIALRRQMIRASPRARSRDRHGPAEPPTIPRAGRCRLGVTAGCAGMGGGGSVKSGSGPIDFWSVIPANPARRNGS